LYILYYIVQRRNARTLYYLITCLLVQTQMHRRTETPRDFEDASNAALRLQWLGLETAGDSLCGFGRSVPVGAEGKHQNQSNRKRIYSDATSPLLSSSSAVVWCGTPPPLIGRATATATVFVVVVVVVVVFLSVERESK